MNEEEFWATFTVAAERQAFEATRSLPELPEPIVEAARRGAFVDYKLYLQTRWWRRVRNRALGRVGRRCQISEHGERCTNHSRLQVHHRHYETLGREDPETDLVVVCPKHHRLIHTPIVERLAK